MSVSRESFHSDKWKHYKSLNIYEDLNFLAYVLGYISADGCLSSTNKAVIRLTSKDHEFLKCVSSRLVEKPRFGHHENNLRIQFSHVDLFKECLAIGITPNKSLTLDVSLQDKSLEYKLHFLRGVIDGDGSVKVRKSLGRSSIEIATASPYFCNFLMREFGFSYFYTDFCSGLYAAYLKGHKAKLLSLILPKADYTLKRKTSQLLNLEGLLLSKKIAPTACLSGSEETLEYLVRTRRYLSVGNFSKEKKEVKDLFPLAKKNPLNKRLYTVTVCIEGKEMSFIEAWQKFALKEISYGNARNRYSRGWGVLEALTTPLRAIRHRSMK